MLRSLKLLSLSLFVSMFVNCSSGEEDVSVDDKDNGEVTVDPDFSGFNIDGSAAAIVDVKVGDRATYLLLEDGTVWYAGKSWGLGEEEESSNFRKIFEGASKINAIGRTLAIIDESNTLHKSAYDNASNTGQFVEVASNVSAFVDGFFGVVRAVPGYITMDGGLWVREPLLPDSMLTSAPDPDKYQLLRENVVYAAINDLVDGKEYHLLTADGNYLLGSTEWSDPAIFGDDLDLYLDYENRQGNYFLLASGVDQLFISGHVHSLIMDDGSFKILRTRGTNYFYFWSGISGDFENTEEENYGKLYDYSVPEDMVNVVGSASGASWFLQAESGALYATGVNLAHGDGTGVNSEKRNVTKVYDDVKMIATNQVGAIHTMVVLNDGTLRGAGANDNGQFGNGTTTSTNSFDQSTSGGGGGDEALLGTWSIPQGTTMTFNDGGTGTILDVDLTGQCRPTNIPFKWEVSGVSITITNEPYTFCVGTPYEFDITERTPSTVNYSVSGNTLTLNGQEWTKS